MPSGSAECEPAWMASVDEGERCEAALAPAEEALVGDEADGLDATAEPSGDEAVARDPASGLPTGKRQHKPFTFVSELDRRSL